MNKILPIIIVVLVVLIVVFTGLSVLRRRRLTTELTTLLYRGQFADFESLASSPEAEKYIHPYNLNYLKLNALLMQGKNPQPVLACFEKMDLTPKMKFSLDSNLFYYYISKENYAKAKACYDEIKSLPIPQGTLEIDRAYDTFVNKGYAYLDQTLNLFEKASQPQKPAIALLIAKMYENKGEAQKAAEYFEMASRDIQADTEKAS